MSSLDVIHKLRQRLHATVAAKPNQWHTGVAMLRFLALMFLLTLLVRGTAATTLPVVSVTAPYQGVVTQSFTVSGQISPGIGTPLTIPEGLLVEQIFVQPGDQVTEGQTLALLSLDDVRTEIEQVQASMQQHQVQANQLLAGQAADPIVIASEDNIEDEENYKTFKEKVVERTVKLDVEYRRIQQEMIEDYKTETSEYKEFLKKKSPKLFQVFEESGSRNLRTFKSCLIDFERVYGLWHSLKLPTDGMGEALYVFVAYLFEVKGGNYKKMDEYDEYHFNFLEEKAEDKKRNPPRWQTTQDGENSKYKRYNAQYRIQPLIRWMIEGEWNEQRIKAALNQRFSVKETAPEREVLDKAFWELSQEIIDRGLPQVLQQAYDGKLTTDDYVALLGRLDDFRKIGVPIQCDVDDARLLQGFHNRKAKIIKGDICEERGHRRLMRDEGETKLTPQEQSLNEEIEKLQDQWPYLMNEIFFIDYLKNPTYERGLAAKSKILVCFNDELLAAFLSAYKKANISEQQEMLTILKEISFRGGAVERDETDTEVTRKNLEKLENALNSEVEHTSDAVKKFYANRHLETVKQIRQKFLNTREM